MTSQPAKTTTSLSDADHARQTQVSNKLAADLHRVISNYRTHDKKPVTEGEVIVAMGFLIGQYVKTPERVTRWVQEIAIAAHTNAKG